MALAKLYGEVYAAATMGMWSRVAQFNVALGNVTTVILPQLTKAQFLRLEVTAEVPGTQPVWSDVQVFQCADITAVPTSDPTLTPTTPSTMVPTIAPTVTTGVYRNPEPRG